MVEHDRTRAFAEACRSKGYFQCPAQAPTYMEAERRAAAAETRKLFMDAVVTMTRYEPSAGS